MSKENHDNKGISVSIFVPSTTAEKFIEETSVRAQAGIESGTRAWEGLLEVLGGLGKSALKAARADAQRQERRWEHSIAEADRDRAKAEVEALELRTRLGKKGIFSDRREGGEE